MIKSYLKTAWRNLVYHKSYSAINIFGLAIGISSSLVIFLIVQYDFSFDKFEKDAGYIYRVVSKEDGGVHVGLGDATRNEVTGLETVAPFMAWDYHVKVNIPKQHNEKTLVFSEEPDIIFADKNYFKLINYKWIAGSPQSSLSEPYQTVLTEQNAKRFFPDLSPDEITGKKIIFNDTILTTVTGIVQNLKSNTDFRFQTFISKATYTALAPNLAVGREELFIKLSKSTNPKQVKNQVTKVYQSHFNTHRNNVSKIEFSLEPLSNLHFRKARDEDFNQGKAYKPALYGLMAVASILLLLACINFINLTTAQSSERAKEIGIRKTLGGSRRQLIFQFLSETFILTSLATLLSIIFAPFLLQAFSDFIPAGIQFDIRQPGIIIFLISITFFVSFVSGIYPALILSSYKPIGILKNQIVSGTGNSRSLLLRKTLTVSQFVIAQVFIIATIIVARQIHFELTKDMGFKKDAVIYFAADFKDTSVAKRQVLLQKFKAIPEIANASLAGFPPSTTGGLGDRITYKSAEKETTVDVRIKPADTNYIHLYGIKLLAGKNIPFSDTLNSYLINEKCAQMLGFKNPQEAIGKDLESSLANTNIPIAGVVSNFIQGSMHDEIAPLVIFSDVSMQWTYNIALRPQNAEGTSWQSAIAKIKKSFKQIYPDVNPDIHFLDETIAKYYTAEQNTSVLLKWATALAIVISILGLLGLVIYTTNQRTKEIGIRKVVGASIAQIITLLSKDFLKLILLAIIIAVPLVWIAANKWLQDFAFRINLSVWLFILGGAFMLLPAFIVLFLKTYKAANANPVESLRSE